MPAVNDNSSQATSNDPYIFLSYSNKDIEAAKSLGKFISCLAKPVGLGFWAQYLELVTAEEYRQVLDSRVKECRVFVLLSTRHSLMSREVRREISQAYYYDRPFIIYKLDDAIPATESGVESIYRDKQWIEVDKIGKKKSLQDFVDHLQDRLLLQADLSVPDDNGLWSDLRSKIVEEHLKDIREKKRLKAEAEELKHLAWQDLFWQLNWDPLRARPKRQLSIQDNELLEFTRKKLVLPENLKVSERRRFRRNKSNFSNYLKKVLELGSEPNAEIDLEIIQELERRRRQACISLLEAIKTAESQCEAVAISDEFFVSLILKLGWSVNLDRMKSLRDKSLSSLKSEPSNSISQSAANQTIRVAATHSQSNPVIASLPPTQPATQVTADPRWPWCPSIDEARSRVVRRLQNKITDLLDDYEWEDIEELVSQFKASRSGSSYLHPLPFSYRHWKRMAQQAIKAHGLSNETWLGSLLLHLNISQFSNRRGLLVFEHGLSIHNGKRLCMPFRTTNQRPSFAPRGGGKLSIGVSGVPFNSVIPVEGKVFSLPGGASCSEGFAVQLRSFIGSLQASEEHWQQLAAILSEECKLLRFSQNFKEYTCFPAVNSTLKSLPREVSNIIGLQQGAIPISDRSTLLTILSSAGKIEGIVVAREGILLVGDKPQYRPWKEIWSIQYQLGQGLRINDLPMLQTLTAAMRQRIGITDTADTPGMLAELAAFLYSLKHRLGLPEGS
jgi:hypothetical protein